MHATLALTHRCNLRCTYCYAGAKFGRRMSVEVMRKALDIAFATPSPVVKVSPFGGEPVLEPELIETLVAESEVRAGKTGKKLFFGITTNGTLLDDAALALLAKHGFEVTVSLDGDEAAHDSARVWPSGRGSFAAVSAAVVRTRERLGSVQTLSVVHPGNVARMAASLDHIVSLGVRTAHFVPNFDANWDSAALALYAKAIDTLADRFIELYRAGSSIHVEPLGAKILSRIKDGSVIRCDFGCDEIAVAPSGRIYPCERLIGEDGPKQSAIVIGHVDTGVDRDRVEAMRAAKNVVKPDCEGCALVDRCRWWCGCVNQSLTGRIDGVGEVLCQMEQIDIRAADRAASTLYAEQNAAFARRYYLPVLGRS